MLKFLINFFVISAITQGDTDVIQMLTKQYPYQVSVQHRSEHVCGGAVISARHVLTAAECVLNANVSYTVRVGSGLHVECDVARVVIHPHFDVITSDNDIAVLELFESITIDSRAAIIDLPNSDDNAPLTAGQVVTVSRIRTSNSNDDTGEGDVVINDLALVVNKTFCSDIYAAIDFNVTDNMLCTTPLRGYIHECNVDFGNPLVRNGLLVGIVSVQQGCSLGDFPGISTNVIQYIHWIRDTTTLHNSGVCWNTFPWNC